MSFEKSLAQRGQGFKFSTLDLKLKSKGNTHTHALKNTHPVPVPPSKMKLPFFLILIDKATVCNSRLQSKGHYLKIANSEGKKPHYRNNTLQNISDY